MWVNDFNIRKWCACKHRFVVKIPVKKMIWGFLALFAKSQFWRVQGE